MFCEQFNIDVENSNLEREFTCNLTSREVLMNSNKHLL
jgi:hypothetical protein